MLAVFIALVNLFLHTLINLIGKYVYKAKNTNEGTTFTVMIIFLAQYINTSFIVILAYHSFCFPVNKITQNDSKDLFVGPFDEFNSRWYLVVGSPIILTILLQILTPHLGLLTHALLTFIRRCWDRRCSFNKSVTRQAVQEEYEDLYTGPEFIL